MAIIQGDVITNSGTLIGRVDTLVKIEGGSLAAVTSYASAAWTSDRYKSLQFVLRGTSGTMTGMGMTLSGLVGTYDMAYAYQPLATFAVGGYGSLSAWFPGGWSSPLSLAVELDVRAGAKIFGTFRVKHYNGSGEQVARGEMGHTQTTGGVTGLGMTFTGGNITGDYELYGVPA